MAEKDLQIWTEKYRPKFLKEVVNQRHAVDRLKAWVKEGSMPHLIFAGAAGVGKTTVAICLARELFGEHWRENFQETNASVTPETPIIVRIAGKIRFTTFGELSKIYYKNDDEKYAKTDDLEILSVDSNKEIKFMPVRCISRHKTDKIIKIKYEGGNIKTSLNHSLIFFDENGDFTSKEASDIEEGDILITFKTLFGGSSVKLKFEDYAPSGFVEWGEKRFRNPKIKTVLQNMQLDDELSWICGTYLAEGCATLKPNGTNGVVIFTLAYPSEIGIARKINNMTNKYFNLDATIIPSASGFDRKKKSSVQVRLWNTQLTKFFLGNFYNNSNTNNASSKRIPDFIFNSSLNERIAFLKGYMGDATGEWGGKVRYSSKSRDNLIGTAWLGRISGLNTSTFDVETRVLWSHLNSKTDYLPAEPFIKLIKKSPAEGMYYLLRHQLYSKQSKRISKKVAKRLLSSTGQKGNAVLIAKLFRLIDSDLSVAKIRKIEVEKYDDYVYDVSVPGSEMFWGGTTPILLHNSDQRGIDIIRGRIKNFAMTKPISADFKIIFLDESDSLTPEAQQALRRTMERFSEVCRFILSCNYSSKIISPIQSRCSVFRFKNMTRENVEEYMSRIAKGESLKVSGDAIDAIYEISEGDLRKATNLLQAAAVTSSVTKESIYDVAAQAKPEDVKEMIRLALSGKFEDARKRLHDMLINQGLSGQDIVKNLHSEIFGLDIPDQDKIRLITHLGETEYRLNTGGSDDVQIEAFLAQVALLGKK